MMAVAAWILTPTGRIVAIAIGLALWTGYIDRRAAWRERNKCDVAAIRSQLVAAQRDLAAARAAADRDRKAAAEIAGDKKRADEENARLQDEIKKLPVADQCIISPDRAKRMQ